jgi:hypothetical protein
MKIPDAALSEELPGNDNNQKSAECPLISQVRNIYSEYGVYKMEFSCDNLSDERKFLAAFQVAGMQHYRDDAQDFIRATPVCLLLERDANNQYDSNAIQVIGISANDRRYMIGYVPADYARRIVASQTLDSVKPMLHMAKISANGFTVVEMTLYGNTDLRRLIEDPDVLAIDDEHAAQRKADEEKWAEERSQRDIAMAPLIEAKELEKAGRYLEAIQIYKNWLTHGTWRDVYDRLSMCYGKLKDHASVVAILDEYSKKCEMEYAPCQKELVNRLDKARVKIGLPKLDETYRKRLLPTRPIDPELYHELYKIGRSDFRLFDSGLHFSGFPENPSLTHIRIDTTADLDTLLSIYPDFPLSTSFFKGGIRMCVAITNWDYQELMKGNRSQ